MPATVPFKEKWGLALTLLRRTRAAGVRITAVVADEEYGDNRTGRQALRRLRLLHDLGISPTLTVFRCQSHASGTKSSLNTLTRVVP